MPSVYHDDSTTRRRLPAQYDGGFLKAHPDWAGEYTSAWPNQHGRRMFPGPGTHRTRRATLPKFLLRQCPKCGGDLHIEDEAVGYGDYACIQCGGTWDVSKVEKTRTRRLRVVLRRTGPAPSKT
jgi:hypothetical protein